MRYFLFIFLFQGFLFGSQANLNVQNVTTDSGISFWYVYSPHSDIVSLSFSFLGGAAQDPKGFEGIGKLATHMLLEGAGGLDKKAFHETLKDRGININFNVSPDFFSGHLTFLRDHPEEAFEYLDLVLFHPHLPESNFRRLKNQYLSFIKNRDENPGYIAQNTSRHMFFQEHAYGREFQGTLSSLPRLKTEDIQMYLRNIFALDTLRLVIVGNISKEDAKTYIHKTFSKLKSHSTLRPIPTFDPEENRASYTHITRDIPQTVAVFTQNGRKKGYPHLMKSSLVMHILASGMTSRLNQTIREDKGLVYYVGGRNQPYRHAGVIKGSFSTETKNVKQAFDLLKREWKRMKDEGPTAKELQDAKTYFQKTHLLNLTTTPALSEQLLSYHTSGFPPEYFHNRQALIAEITVDDLKQEAQNLLDENLMIVTVGRGDRLDL